MGTIIISSLLVVGDIVLWRAISFIDAYNKEKGKNAATKEDIGEITKEMESVKSEFTEQTERLKSQLTLLTNVKSDIYSLERKAIIDANEKLYLLMSHILEMPALEDNDDIDRYLKIMDVRFREQGNSEALMQLFIDDDQILKSYNIVSKKVLNIQKEKMKMLYDIKKQNRNPHKSKDLIERLVNQWKSESDKQLILYAELTPYMQKLRSNCRKYIYSKVQAS